MKTTDNPITINSIAKATTSIIVLALLIGILSLPILARGYEASENQDEHKSHHEKAATKETSTGKKGVFHLTEKTFVGDVVLKPGMYQVQHVEQGSEHVLVFNEMEMSAGYRMGNTPVGKEVARQTCKVEPVNKAVSNTKLTLRTNAANMKSIGEIQIAGERVKHIL
ncbi:MAG: hypothetical protein AB1757_10695 [Acidobacteriota bacterium]